MQQNGYITKINKFYTHQILAWKLQYPDRLDLQISAKPPGFEEIKDAIELENMRAQVRRDTISGIKNETGKQISDWRILESEKGKYAKRAVDDFEKKQSERLARKEKGKGKEKRKGKAKVSLMPSHSEKNSG